MIDDHTCTVRVICADKPVCSHSPHTTHLTQHLDNGTLGHLRLIGERSAGCMTALILVALSQDISFPNCLGEHK